MSSLYYFEDIYTLELYCIRLGKSINMPTYLYNKLVYFKTMFCKAMYTKNYKQLEENIFFKMLLGPKKGYKNILTDKHFRCHYTISELDYDSIEQKKFVMFVLCEGCRVFYDQIREWNKAVIANKEKYPYRGDEYHRDMQFEKYLFALGIER